MSPGYLCGVIAERVIVDIKTLECFCEAYKTHSLTQAAAASFFSRQAVGKMIKNLEAELGAALFERNFDGVQPTLTADEIYPYARRIVELYKGLTEVAEQQRTADEVLSIAVARGVSNTISERIFPEFSCNNAGIQLDITVAESSECEMLVKDGIKEIALSTAPVETSALDSMSLLKEPLYLYGSMALLDEKGGIRQGTPLLLMSKTFKLDRLLISEHGDLIEGLAIKDGLGDYDRIIENVKMGAGVCVGPACYLPLHDKGSMFRWPIESEHCCWEIVLLNRENAKLSKSAAKFVTYLCDFLLQ